MNGSNKTSHKTVFFSPLINFVHVVICDKLVGVNSSLQVACRYNWSCYIYFERDTQ